MGLTWACPKLGYPPYLLGGQGLLLVPSVFAWPAFNLILDLPWQPTLAHTPRGAANLWLDAAPPVGQALASLLSRGRASVLLGAESPSTTRQLASRLQLATSRVSEHLGVLRRAGLVLPRRDGRVVYYRLSATGAALLDLLEGAAEVPCTPDLDERRTRLSSVTR